MSDENIETGYMPDVSSGLIRHIKFCRKSEDRVWGIDKNGRANWTAGTWTIGKDIFLTAQEAIHAGEATRDKKLAALRTQIEKLESVVFKLDK